MRIIPEESYGVIENLLASMIFFSPNFLFLFPFVNESPNSMFLVFLYNFVIIFIITSAMSHYRFCKENVLRLGDKSDYDKFLEERKNKANSSESFK